MSDQAPRQARKSARLPARRAPAPAPAAPDWFDKKIDKQLSQRRRARQRMAACVIGLALIVVAGLAAWLISNLAHGAGAVASAATNPAALPGSAPATPPAAGAETTDQTQAAASVASDPLDVGAADMTLEGQTHTAQRQLKAQLSDSHQLSYRDVHMFVQGAAETAHAVFCGEVDSVDPAGAHVGYQHFITSADKAEVENMMTPWDFTQAWTRRCAGRESPQGWG